MSEFVEVRIQGQVFRLKTDIGKEYVHELVAFVDGIMKKMARQSVSIPVDRVAIMAALDIADSYIRLQKQEQVSESGNTGISKDLVDRVQRLINEADRLLEEQ
ncbi:MAG: cell division protein ZapA [Magnetococcus sp. DMHC-1]|nr:cell division protein ZapA [Magnetococcales bacterium]